jgi:DNA-binding NarL/FixJ family response regulator
MSADPTKRRVAVADDDVLLREGVVGVLERSGFEVTGQAGDATELLRLVRDQQPDLVITDIRMPPQHETEGLDAARTIRRELPDIGILVLSAHVEVAEAMEILATGRGIGYLLKSRITKVEDFDPAIVQELVQVRHREDRLERVTQREREVLDLMAQGASNAGIAKRLWVTEGTVEKHVRSILSKLELSEAPDDHRRVLAVLTFLDSR